MHAIVPGDKSSVAQMKVDLGLTFHVTAVKDLTMYDYFKMVAPDGGPMRGYVITENGEVLSSIPDDHAGEKSVEIVQKALQQ